MKNNFFLIIIVFFLSSCSDNLDIVPITQKSADNFYSSETEIESAITGLYAILQNGGLYGLDIIGVGEVPGEDSFEEIAANDAGRFGQLDDFSTNAANDLVSNIWQQSYRGIQRANVVLNRIDPIDYTKPETKTQRIGEVKFIRALLYFNLVRLYGDVPLVVEETINPSSFFGKGRTSAKDVYAQIEKDLNDAIQNLDNTKVYGRPAKGAALALLADVQMNQGNYQGAVTNLATIVNSNIYKLMPSTDKIFGVANEKNAEVLFEIVFQSGIDGNREGSPAATQFRPSGVTGNAKGHNLPSTGFVNMYDTVDTRKKDYVGVNTAKNPFYYSTKYEVSTTGVNDSGTDYYVIRYADVLLKYAEALNEINMTSEAARHLDAIRNRAGLGNTTATTKSEMAAAIDMERRSEFIGEGHRWFDLKRTGKAIETMNKWFADNGKNVVIDQDNLILPIPQSQIDTDPAISQNSGY
ncbi:MAG TPA: RagB/SusD family nutrient uptake outer membrane protein [Saprospiraceae bacterium]|nr:RagB/SusD family nutrient uptake outer membrane protein [Saprospiraceae bacterium]